MFIDSDILVYPDTLRNLISRRKEVIASLVKNDNQHNENTNFYNFVFVPNGWDHVTQRKRIKREGIIKVDLTGACILISQKAYNSGKYYGISGGDFGFSRDMANAGIDMFVDCETKVYHAFNKQEFYEDKKQGIIP